MQDRDRSEDPPFLRRRARRPLSAALTGCLLVAGLTEPASAFDLFGVHLWGEKKQAEPTSPDAQPYTVTLDVLNADKDLTARVQGASLLYSSRDDRPPPSTAAFLSRVEAEYARITAGLYTEGYYGGVVTITVDGRDPATIARDARLPRPVPVAISVDPGPRFVFGRIRIENRPPVAVEAKATPEGRGLVAGEVARSAIVLQSEEALIAGWRAAGHPKAKIAKRDVVADHVSRTLDVTIVVDPDRPARYGTISVTGTAQTDPDFVIRESGLRPGEPFDPQEIDRAQKQLQRLQIFNASRIVEGDIGPDGTIPLTITVVERKLHVIGGGVSYSTVDGAGIEGYWEKRNLFGRGERFRLEGRVGGISSTDPTDFSYLLAATFTKPGVITPTTDLVARLAAKREVLDAYTEDSIQGRIGLTHGFSDQLTGHIAANLEYDKDEDALGKRDFVLASVPMGLAYDGTDNALDPTRGFKLKGDIEPFYEFNYGNAGLITDLGASAYVPIGDRVVLAARAAMGSIVGAAQSEIPDGRLFFLGGSDTIRGYGYRNVAPRLPNDDLVGGRSYVAASVEARIKITDKIGLVPFIDAGNAYASSFPDFSGDLKVGAGLGLRYQTGLGPVRVDVAVPLNRGPDDPSVALYVGLGQAF